MPQSTIGTDIRVKLVFVNMVLTHILQATVERFELLL